MKYSRIIISKFGGPENLHLIKEEIPEPSANQVRVKILTAGVSLADILIREGIHPESLFKRPPLCIGLDIVGVVDKIGDKASRTSTWRIGDTVAALPIVGGYAEYLCLPPDQLVPVPYGLDPAEVVSVILNYTTAYQTLMRSYKALRTGGRLIGYGFGSKSKDRRSRAGQIVSNVVNWISVLALNLIPDSRKVIPYSIQTLKRRKPHWFREDLQIVFNLLRQQKIKPIISTRLPLNQAVQAHDLLESGSMTGKIVLICNPL